MLGPVSKRTRNLDETTPELEDRELDTAETWTHPGERPVGEMPTVFHHPTETLLAMSAQEIDRMRISDNEPPVSSRILPKAKGPLGGAPLPPNAPEWMRLARSLSVAMEALIAGGTVTEWDKIGVERAALAWSLVGTSRHRMYGVARLVRRAHAAIRATERDQMDQAVRDCAQIVYQALPKAMRRTTSLDAVTDMVWELRDEADPWLAVVDASSRLLGWTNHARAHAAHALRRAIEMAEGTSNEG